MTRKERTVLHAAIALLNAGGPGTPHHVRLIATDQPEWQALRHAVLALPNVTTAP